MKNKILLAIALGALLLYCDYAFIISDWRQQLTANAKQILVLKQHSSLPAPSLQSPAFNHHYYSQLALKLEFKDVLQNVVELAQLNQLMIQQIKPEETQIIDQFSVIPIVIALHGKFQNIANFIAALNQLEYFVAIPAFKITKNNDALDTELQLFSYNNNHSTHPITIKKLALLAALPLTRDPFNLLIDIASNKKADITQWESKDLNLVGIIKEPHAKIAVIQDPLDFVYHITIGELIGIQKSRVLKITDNCVIAANSSQNVCGNI
jgi:Tfp pilus assembly protein PilO